MLHLFLPGGALLVLAMGAFMLTSAAIGSVVLGISTYDVAACFLVGSLTGSVCYVTSVIFFSWLHDFTEQASVAAREEAYGPGYLR